jgi:hypothetical protein
MADSRIYQILQAIQGKVAADFTAGASEIDMTDLCLIGLIDQPTQIPLACCSFLEFTTEHGLHLGSYTMTPRFEVYVFVGGGDVQERIKNAMNLCSDMIKNLTADRFLSLGSGYIDDVLCSFTAIDGDRYGLEGIGIGYIEITTPFQSRTGV